MSKQKKRSHFVSNNESLLSDENNNSAAAQAARWESENDDDLPRVVRMPGLRGKTLLTDDEYTALFVSVVRAILQPSPWNEVAEDDRIAMLRRAREVFVEANDTFTDKMLKRIVRRVARENSLTSLRHQYLVFMRDNGRIAWTHDTHRDPDNWFSLEGCEEFRDHCFASVSKRLKSINRLLSVDYTTRTNTWRTFLDISTGAAMHEAPRPADMVNLSYRTAYVEDESGAKVVNPAVETDTKQDDNNDDDGDRTNEPVNLNGNASMLTAEELFADAPSSCFGNVLHVTVTDVVWRPSNIEGETRIVDERGYLPQFKSVISRDSAEKQLSKQSSRHPSTLNLSVSTVLGGVPQYHALDFKGKLATVDTDPTINAPDYYNVAPAAVQRAHQRTQKPNSHTNENSDEAVAHVVPMVATATSKRPFERYWAFDDPRTVSIFLGDSNISPMMTEFHLKIKKPEMMCFLSFTDVATIKIKASDLYHQVLPLGCAGRELNPSAGFHLVHKHYVDSESGFGATVTLRLDCQSRIHNSPPILFDPNDPEEGIDLKTNEAHVPVELTAAYVEEELRIWEDQWSVDLHNGLTTLFDMCGSIKDLEFMILQQYADRYLIDKELFDVASLAAVVKFSPFDNEEERQDAVSAMAELTRLAVGVKTKLSKEYAQFATDEIKARLIDIVCQIETLVGDAGQANAAFDDAITILSACGVPTAQFSSLISERVEAEITEAIEAYRALRKSKSLSSRASKLYTFVSRVYGDVRSCLDFAEAATEPNSNQKKVLAIALMRIDVTLTTLIPALDQFVKEILRKAVEAVQNQNEGSDQLGDTFSVLSTLYSKSIELADRISPYSLLEKVAAKLGEIFDPFLASWLSLAEKRASQWMRLCVEKNTLDPIAPGRVHFNQAPADAKHLLNEFFDFFVQAGECCPEEVIVGTATLFCKLVLNTQEAFVQAIIERGRSIKLGDADANHTTDERLLRVAQSKMVCVATLHQFGLVMKSFWSARVFPELVDPLAADHREELLGSAMAIRAQSQAAFSDAQFAFSETYVCRDFVRSCLQNTVFEPWRQFVVGAKDKKTAATIAAASSRTEDAVALVNEDIAPLLELFVHSILDGVNIQFFNEELSSAFMRGIEEGYLFTATGGPQTIALNDEVLAVQHRIADRLEEELERIVRNDIASRLPKVNLADFQSKLRHVLYLSKQSTSELIETANEALGNGTQTRSSGVAGVRGGTTNDWVVLLLKNRGEAGDRAAASFVKKLRA